MSGPAIARAIAASHESISRVLEDLDDAGLRAPSLLPEWDRLTIICHLRYGATAVNRIFEATRAGEPVAFYPGGRAEQRPTTLVPAVGETARDVVRSFAECSGKLDATLASLGEDEWALESAEPADNPDVGSQTLESWGVLRLTEAEVHAGDLLLGLDKWSATLVDHGLPLRFERLLQRLANQPPIDHAVEGTWLLRTLEGDAWTVTLEPKRAEVRTADYDTRSDATITASRRDMLAFLLGRPLETEAVYAGDIDLAASFQRAFPGP